jgi:hypothetical protein
MKVETRLGLPLNIAEPGSNLRRLGDKVTVSERNKKTVE